MSGRNQVFYEKAETIKERLISALSSFDNFHEVCEVVAT